MQEGYIALQMAAIAMESTWDIGNSWWATHFAEDVSNHPERKLTIEALANVAIYVGYSIESWGL